MQRGRHDDLLAGGGLYAELYRTQFAGPVRAAAEFGSQATQRSALHGDHRAGQIGRGGGDRKAATRPNSAGSP